MSWYQSDLQYTSPEPYVPPTWADGTDEEIATALQKHYDGEIDLTEYWSVGDERVISLNYVDPNEDTTETGQGIASQDMTLILTNAGGKYLEDGTTECAFQVDFKTRLILSQYNDLIKWNLSSNASWASCTLRSWIRLMLPKAMTSSTLSLFKPFKNEYRNAKTLKTIVETFSIRSESEVFDSVTYGMVEGSQASFYTNSANRSISGKSDTWMRSRYQGTNTYNVVMWKSDGNRTINNNPPQTANCCVLPFGVI